MSFYDPTPLIVNSSSCFDFANKYLGRKQFKSAVGTLVADQFNLGQADLSIIVAENGFGVVPLVKQLT